MIRHLIWELSNGSKRGIAIRWSRCGYLPGINILNDCSLDLFEGELIGIIGETVREVDACKSYFGLVNIRQGSVQLRAKT